MIDILNEDITNLSDLFVALKKDDNGDENPRTDSLYSLAIPDDVEGRRTIFERAIFLFNESLRGLKQLDSKGKAIPDTSIVTAEPRFSTPWKKNEIISPVALRDIDGKMRTILDPEDPKFSEAFNDRLVGIIALLTLIHDFHARLRNTGLTLQNVTELTGTVENKKLSELPWEGEDGRQEHLGERATIMRKNIKHAGTLKNNNISHQTLKICFQGNGLNDEFTRVISAFDGGVEKFWKEVNEYDLADYIRVFYGRLERIKLIMLIKNKKTVSPEDKEEAKQDLQQFQNDLLDASTPEEFQATINNFKKKKMQT